MKNKTFSIELFDDLKKILNENVAEKIFIGKYF